MTTWTAILIGYLIVEAAAQILTIGRPRKPRTPTDAFVGCVVFALIIWALAA